MDGKLDGRSIAQIERDNADQQLRCAVTLAEIGYMYHRNGKSLTELRADIIAEYAEHLRSSNGETQKR